MHFSILPSPSSADYSLQSNTSTNKPPLPTALSIEYRRCPAQLRVTPPSPTARLRILLLVFGHDIRAAWAASAAPYKCIITSPCFSSISCCSSKVLLVSVTIATELADWNHMKKQLKPLSDLAVNCRATRSLYAELLMLNQATGQRRETLVRRRTKEEDASRVSTCQARWG